MKKIVLFGIFLSLFSVRSGAKEFVCLESVDEMDSRAVTWFKSHPLSLVTQTSAKAQSGMIGSNTVFLSKNTVCRRSMDFAKFCKGSTKESNGQFQYSFSCEDKTSGSVYFDESGGLAFSCEVASPNEPALLVSSECKELKQPESKAPLAPDYHVLAVRMLEAGKCVLDPDRSLFYDGPFDEASVEDNLIRSLKMLIYPAKGMSKIVLEGITLKNTGKSTLEMILDDEAKAALVKAWTTTPKQKVFSVTLEPKCVDEKTYLLYGYERRFEKLK